MQALNTAHSGTSVIATIMNFIFTAEPSVHVPAHNTSSIQRHRLVKQVFVQKKCLLPTVPPSTPLIDFSALGDRSRITDERFTIRYDIFTCAKRLTIWPA